MIQKSIITVATLLLSAITMAQTIIYVDADATGNSDGTSWANAYNDLYVALYVTSNDTNYTGAQIWIAEGFYTRLAQNQTFDVDNDVLLYGGFEGTESSIDDRDIENHPTIISGDVDWNDTGVPSSSNSSMGQNAATIFRVLSPIRALFDGLIIEHAFSTTESGGGINVINQTLSNLQISNCTIRENVSLHSAGVLYYAYSYGSGFYMFNNKIEDNVNTDAAYSYTIDFRAAQTYSIYADVHFVNNLFKNNTSESMFQMGTCARFTVYGGSDVDLYLTNNTFIDNPQTGYNSSNESSLIVYEHGGNGSSLYAYLNNNIFYNNNGVTDVLGESIYGSSPSGSLNVYNTSSNQNVQDFADNLNLQNTHIVSSSPFVDYPNGNYSPIAAYQTIGDANYYDSQYLVFPYANQEYPTTDLAGNPRFNAQGEMAIGAYQPDGSASLTDVQRTSNFILYPNPVNEVLTIDFSNNVSGEATVYSLAGSELTREPINGISKQLSFANIPSGNYLVKIETNEGIFTEMITVK